MARQWRPDVVVHPVTELAGAVAARLTGARHVVHGLGPLPADAWQWVRAAAHTVRTEIDRMPGPDEVVASLVDRQ